MSVYKCRYCQKPYDKEEDAIQCYYSHDIQFVPISREDLNRLLMFIFTKEDDLITPTLYRTLQVYFEAK
mgnify:CR=1 FL=1